MRLRFVTHAYPPLFYPRAIQISLLARALAPLHDLEIVAADFGRQDPALLPLCADCRTTRVTESLLADRINTMRGDRIRRWLLPDFMSLNLAPFKRQLDRMDWNGVHLVTFGQPMSMHLLGLHYKRRYPSSKWIAHFSDPWRHADYSTATGLAAALNRKHEAQVYSHADHLLFTSPETIEAVLKDAFLSYRIKARAIPHGFDPALYGPDNDTGDAVIGYFGTFYGQRKPDPLFAALRLIVDRDPSILHTVKFRFYGAGDGSDHATLIRGLKPYIEFLPGVDYLQSLRLMRQIKALIVIDAPAQNSVFFPSKLADYIGANRPIFGLTPTSGASARILTSLGMLVADPSNVASVAQALENFLKNLREHPMTLNQAVRENYAGEAVARAFMAAIN